MTTIIDPPMGGTNTILIAWNDQDGYMQCCTYTLILPEVFMIIGYDPQMEVTLQVLIAYKGIQWLLLAQRGRIARLCKTKINTHKHKHTKASICGTHLRGDSCSRRVKKA